MDIPEDPGTYCLEKNSKLKGDIVGTFSEDYQFYKQAQKTPNGEITII